MSDSDNRLKMAAVPGFSDYVITNRGRIYKRKPGGGFKSLKPTPRKHSGHLLILLYRDGERLSNGKLKPYGKSVHCLVLEAFVGPCPPGMECRHLNGKEWENDLSNLKWGTRQENINDRKHLNELAFGTSKPNAILTEAIVVSMRRRVSNGEFAIDVAESLGIKRLTAVSAIVGRTWKHVSEPPVKLEKNAWKRGMR